jgi:uncharacterized protein (TIGR02598 family)
MVDQRSKKRITRCSLCIYIVDWLKVVWDVNFKKMNFRTPQKTISRPKVHSGATLVEVVITVGILATMLLPLISLLSLAIDHSGKAINDTVSSQIASHLVGEIQQESWEKLSLWDGKVFYFDDQGVELKTDNAEKAIYTAKVKLDPLTVGLSLATESQGVPVNPNGRKALVLVTSLAGSRGTALLTESEAALQSGKPLPKHVYVSRSLLVKLEQGI